MFCWATRAKVIALRGSCGFLKDRSRGTDVGTGSEGDLARIDIAGLCQNRYMLTLIDCFSERGWTILSKNKSPHHWARADGRLDASFASMTSCTQQSMGHSKSDLDSTKPKHISWSWFIYFLEIRVVFVVNRIGNAT